MTRYFGFITRPLIRLYAANEIIACGLCEQSGNVSLIFTPAPNEQNFSVLLRQESWWQPVGHERARNFAGSTVRRFSVPHANTGDVYKMQGEKGSGRKITSPTITVKQETVYNPGLLGATPYDDGSVLFSWKVADTYRPMIYFLVLVDDAGKTLAGVYTRELAWRYPRVKKASYSVGPKNPPNIVSGKQYTATLVLVDFDGWVSHVAQRDFSI